MKIAVISIISTTLLLPFTSFAAGSNAPDMQNMMKQMQQIQNCMAKVDQTAIANIQTKAKATEAKIQNLCKSGKSDEAKKIAIQFGKEINSSPALLTMQACTKDLQAQIPGMALPDFNKDFANKNICEMKFR